MVQWNNGTVVELGVFEKLFNRAFDFLWTLISFFLRFVDDTFVLIYKVHFTYPLNTGRLVTNLSWNRGP